MFRKQHAPFSFLMALLLFFSFTFPTEAATPQSPTLMWETNFTTDRWADTDFFSTSKNDSFITALSPKFENFKRVYQFDVMKVDAKGMNLRDLSIEADVVQFAEIDGQTIMAAISVERQVLELYNEELELIQSKALPNFPETHKVIDLHIHDEVLTILSRGRFFDDQILTHYNVNDLSTVSNVELPLESYTSSEYDGNLLIQGTSTIGSIVEEITVSANDLFGDMATEPISFWGDSFLVEQDGYLYAAIPFYVGDYVYWEEVPFTGLYKIDKNGKVLNKTITEANSFIQVGNFFWGVEDFKYVTYDTELMPITNDIPTVTGNDPYLSLEKVADDLFAYRIHNEVVFANAEGKKQFTHQIKDGDYAFYTTMNGQYFQSWGVENHLYDIKTGKRVDIDSSGYPVVHGNQIAVFNSEESAEQHNHTVKMYTTEPPAVEDLTNKEWTITFSQDVDEATVSDKSIYVINDENGKKVDGLTFTTKDKQVIVHPPKNGYEKDTNYTLHVTDNVMSVKDIKLKEAKTKSFYVK